MASFFQRLTRFRPTETLGTGGTSVSWGYVDVKEKEPELSSGERWRSYSDIMVNVGIVGAGVRYFLNLLAKVTWKADPADDTPEALDYADRVEKIMYEMETPWSRVIRRAALYRFYGFGLQEWTAVRRPDGMIGFSRIDPRPVHTIERWDIDDDQTKVWGVIQRSPTTAREIYIPRGKMIYLVDDMVSDSPEGIGLFRHMFPLAKRLQRLERIEADGFETDLRGIPVVRAPLSIMDQMVRDGSLQRETRDQMLADISKFGENHIRSQKSYVKLDSAVYRSQDDSGSPSQVRLWDVELLRGESQAFIGIDKAIERQIYSIARLIGVEHLLLGSTAVGSFALSKDKTQNFYLVVDSSLNEIAESFNIDFLGPLWKLNGWPDEMMPTLKPEPVRFRDVEQISTTLQQMAQAGAVLDPNDPAINELRDLMGISRAETVEMEVDASLNRPPKPDLDKPMEGGEEDADPGSGNG